MNDKYVPTPKDWLICVAKDIWYAVTDRLRIWWGRWTWQDSPYITIIVPTRNRWDLVQKRLMPSLEAQTYPYWHVLLVDDDGDFPFPTSLNGIPQVSYVWSHPKVYNYPNTAWGRWCAGPVQAMNYARKFFRNEGWVIRVDDDDELRPTALEDLRDWIHMVQEETPVELVSAQHNAMGAPVTPYRLRDHVIGGIQTTLCKAYVARLPYNRDCWRKSWDCMNDVDWVVRAINAGVKTSYLPAVVCDINPRPGQTDVGWKAQQTEYRTGD